MYDNTVEAADYIGTDIYKSINPNLIPVRKTVTSNGKTFTRTYYVKPKDYVSFASTKDAVEFLAHTQDALNHLAPIVKRLESYNAELATKAYEAMLITGKKSYTLSDRVVSVGEWSSNRPVNTVSDMLAMLKEKTEGNKKVGWADVQKIFADITYTITHSGLTMTNDESDKPIAKIEAKGKDTFAPTNWSSKLGGVVAAINNKIAKVSDYMKARFTSLGGNAAAFEIPKPQGKVEPVESRKKLIVKKKKDDVKKITIVKKKKSKEGGK